MEIIIDPFFHSYFTEKQTSSRSKLEIKRRLGILAKEYVDFTNDILQKYSFFKDGSFVKLFIKRIKILNHNDACSKLDEPYCTRSSNSHIADEGGICAKYHEVKDVKDPKVLQWQSHNTGVVNFAYHLKELPQSVSKLAFSHEIGHSFGSPHDHPEKCLGDDVEGNFLMHKSGVRGYLQNNYQLSPCSYHNITFFF